MQLNVSNLIITKTVIDNLLLQKVINYYFIENKLALINKIKKIPESNILDNLWENSINKGGVIVKNFIDKKHFRLEILDLYKNYDSKTLIFLGNLNEYSEQLQEGMLRFLEEPPVNTIPVLFIENENLLLPTIQSRVNKVYISNYLLFELLDNNDLEKIRNTFPSPKETVKYLLNSPEKIKFPDLSKIERYQIDIWLWQLQLYLEKYFIETSNPRVANCIAKVSKALQLNQQNIQKKLTLEYLLI